MPITNKIQKATTPSRNDLITNRKTRLEIALDSSPIDKKLINRGRDLERKIQANKVDAIEKTRAYEQNKARGTQSSAIRKPIK